MSSARPFSPYYWRTLFTYYCDDRERVQDLFGWKTGMSQQAYNLCLGATLSCYLYLWANSSVPISATCTTDEVDHSIRSAAPLRSWALKFKIFRWIIQMVLLRHWKSLGSFPSLSSWYRCLTSCYDVPPKSRRNWGISTAVSFDMRSDRSVYTQPSCDGSFRGVWTEYVWTGISWMLRVLVVTVKYLADHIVSWTTAATHWEIFSIPWSVWFPSSNCHRFGWSWGGLMIDDIGHYFTTNVRYQWFGWFHNTKEYSSLWLLRVSKRHLCLRD